MADFDPANGLADALQDVDLADDEPKVRSLSPPQSATAPSSSWRAPDGHSEATQNLEEARHVGHGDAWTEERLDEDDDHVEGDSHDSRPDALEEQREAASPDVDQGESFEAVSIDDGAPSSLAADRSTPPPSSSSISSAPTLSESASTAPTTVADSSSSKLPVSTADSSAPTVAPSSPSPPPEPEPQPQPHPAKVEQHTPKKQTSTKKPNMMQKVVSMTRQRDLPPKSKEEEEKHLKELAEMRVASQEAEKRHKSELDARAAARAAAIASALPTWESHILPNWRTVLHSDSQGRSLRSLWWQGTMPVRFRGRLWAMCIGNGLTVPKSAYFQALGRAKRGLEEGRKDMKRVQEEAEEDSQRTLPTLKLFQRGGVMHEDLMDLLLAWSVYEKVSPRYPQGLAYPAALLLVNMPVQEAFVSLVNIVKKSFLRSFYGDDPEEVEAYYRVFDTLLADTMPRVYASFSAAVVRPSLYLFPWLTTLYVHFLPLDLSTRLFDVFLLEGDSFMFRTALVLLQILEPRLFNPNLEELGAVFRGEDKGAVAVVRREKGLLTADGGSVEERDGGVRIEVEDVYAEMGASEERVFELLGALEWKEETWERLVERELPEAD
ncbi:hypothetical protein JCM1841_002983 [Sporobolomyces salmonicolor]